MKTQQFLAFVAASENTVNDYRKYINKIDYEAEVARGMSLRGHESNAEYCLDKSERQKFEAAVKYLGKKG